MRIAVVFDTPYEGWDHPDHERQMAREVAAWRDDEPEMEYQIADALRQRGHEVYLVGIGDDLQYLVRCLCEMRPELVFNCAESFHANPALEYLVPGVLEAEGYRYTGAPPLALLVSRNKAMSRKILAYHGIRVPGFATYRPGERVEAEPLLSYWLRDYARLDVRLASNGEVWFLEANANPFISYGHDMANAAQKAGLDFYRFIQRLVDVAIVRYERA